MALGGPATECSTEWVLEREVEGGLAVAAAAAVAVAAGVCALLETAAAALETADALLPLPLPPTSTEALAVEAPCTEEVGTGGRADAGKRLEEVEKGVGGGCCAWAGLTSPPAAARPCWVRVGTTCRCCCRCCCRCLGRACSCCCPAWGCNCTCSLPAPAGGVRVAPTAARVLWRMRCTGSVVRVGAAPETALEGAAAGGSTEWVLARALAAGLTEGEEAGASAASASASAAPAPAPAAAGVSAL